MGNGSPPRLRMLSYKTYTERASSFTAGLTNPGSSFRLVGYAKDRCVGVDAAGGGRNRNKRSEWGPADFSGWSPHVVSTN